MLKLSALDVEDLAVISAQMQDAVLLAGDLKYLPRSRQFILLSNRFAWDEVDTPQRRRTALHFDRVLSAKTLNMSHLEKDEVLSLLSVTFTELDPPSGEVLLTFADGATIRLAVECLECQMADLGPAWAAQGVPQHPLDDDGAGEDASL
jgi:hypothetical protein